MRHQLTGTTTETFLHYISDRVDSTSWRDRLRSRRLLARGAQPGHHHRRHSKLLLEDQLPDRVAQNGSRKAEAQQEVAPGLEGEGGFPVSLKSSNSFPSRPLK